MSVYDLDANVFIEAAKHYYSFDIAPAFWDALESHSQAGTIVSIDRVKEEIVRGKDHLADWVKGPFTRTFHSTDDPVIIAEYGPLMRWVSGQPYVDAAKAEFAKVADGWLVAHAKARGHTVVTLEQPNPAMRRKVPIPSVCSAFGVPYINSFEMLRRLGIRLG